MDASLLSGSEHFWELEKEELDWRVRRLASGRVRAEVVARCRSHLYGLDAETAAAAAAADKWRRGCLHCKADATDDASIQRQQQQPGHHQRCQGASCL